MCNNNKIVINKELLAYLLRDSYKLSCLEAGGVDNWKNYSEALSGKDLDELKQMIERIEQSEQQG